MISKKTAEHALRKPTNDMYGNPWECRLPSEKKTNKFTRQNGKIHIMKIRHLKVNQHRLDKP